MEGIDFLEAESGEHGEIIDFMNEHFVPHEPLNIQSIYVKLDTGKHTFCYILNFFVRFDIIEQILSQIIDLWLLI